jgi:hypothetical protein
MRVLGEELRRPGAGGIDQRARRHAALPAAAPAQRGLPAVAPRLASTQAVRVSTVAPRAFASMR